MQPGLSDGHIDVFLKVEPVEKNAKLPNLVVQDVTGTSTSAFQQIGNPTFLGRSETKAYWRTSWMPEGQAAYTAPSRVLYVKFGDVSDLITIMLPKPDALQVTLTGPGYPLKLGDSHDIAFRVVSSGKLTHVTPVFSSLVDEKTGQVIPVDELSVESSGKSSNTTHDGATIEGPEQVAHLRLAPHFSKPGKFTGNVSLTSLEKPELGSFAVTIYSTSIWRKFLGGLLLAMGVAIYFGVAIWAKGRNKELLAALPVARLKEQAQSLKRIVVVARQKSNVPFTNLLSSPQNSLDSVVESLSIKALKANGYLPQDFLSAFSAADVSTSYQNFLAGVGNRLSALEMIVRSGMGAVLSDWGDLEKGGKLNIGAAAFQRLDDLAGATLTPDQLKSEIETVIRTVHAAASPTVSFAGGTAPWTPIAEMGFREITVQLQQLSKVVWLLWAVGTVFVGLLVLVLFNNAFGSTQDCVQCLLWGIGMPAAAQGFGGLNAGSLTSALSLPIPR